MQKRIIVIMFIFMYNSVMEEMIIVLDDDLGKHACLSPPTKIQSHIIRLCCGANIFGQHDWHKVLLKVQKQNLNVKFKKNTFLYFESFVTIFIARCGDME